MSSTPGFVRAAKISFPVVLGFHGELYSGIQSTDVLSVPSVLGFHDELFSGIRSYGRLPGSMAF